MKMAKRLDALESKATPAAVERWHHVVQTGDQTLEEAIDAYGRDKIGPDDGTIVFRSVTARFDAEGNMILLKDWPENQPPSV